jgi:hypothetical protein
VGVLALLFLFPPHFAGAGNRRRRWRKSKPHIQQRYRYRGYKVRKGTVVGGKHWRISKGRKIIHLWRPAGYHHRRAGIVVYVHGHNTSVDQTWYRFRLAEQFRRSGRNALFIAVNGPRNKKQRVKFVSIKEVFQLVTRYARVRLPKGRIVAMAHSSGSRTVHRWLGFRPLDHVILLDGLFTGEKMLARWVRKRRSRRVHLVAKKTRSHCVRLAKTFTHRAFISKRIPRRLGSLSRRQKRARIFVLLSQYSHAALVYNQKVIPVMLGFSGLKTIRRLEGAI